MFEKPRGIRFLAGAAALLLGAFSFTVAGAQDFPNAPVKLIVPVPAGGVTDVMARLVGQGLSDLWGQTVVIENRPGGNYSVGAQAVAKSPADGYTLLVAPDSVLTANPFLFDNLIYNVKEFTPISLLCRATPMLVVGASLGVSNIKELLALARSKPVRIFSVTGTSTARTTLVRMRATSPSSLSSDEPAQALQTFFAGQPMLMSTMSAP